jgi:hypothetical protein
VPATTLRRRHHAKANSEPGVLDRGVGGEGACRGK